MKSPETDPRQSEPISGHEALYKLSSSKGSPSEKASGNSACESFAIAGLGSFAWQHVLVSQKVRPGVHQTCVYIAEQYSSIVL